MARANEVAEEVCSSMRTVRSFANESDEAARYATKLDVTYGLKIKEAFAFAGYMWSNQVHRLASVDQFMLPLSVGHAVSSSM